MYNAPGYFSGNPNTNPNLPNGGYMGYSPTRYSPPPQQSMIKGRPVSNEEEANAAMIDFDGSIFVFLDNAHRKVYTKQLGMDGNIIFCRYSLDAPSTPVAMPPENTPSYVTQEEMNTRLEEIREFLTQKLDQLTNPDGGNL